MPNQQELVRLSQVASEGLAELAAHPPDAFRDYLNDPFTRAQGAESWSDQELEAFDLELKTSRTVTSAMFQRIAARMYGECLAKCMGRWSDCYYSCEPGADGNSCRRECELTYMRCTAACDWDVPP